MTFLKTYKMLGMDGGVFCTTLHFLALSLTNVLPMYPYNLTGLKPYTLLNKTSSGKIYSNYVAVKDILVLYCIVLKL